jgi:glycosyltransferase involved in cell wall biosynthesis
MIRRFQTLGPPRPAVIGSRRRQPRFSVACVVPIYNEAAIIARFLESLHRTVAALDADVELIVVNDGSSDRSGEEIERVARWLSVHYIELSRNFGKEMALQAGLDAANSDCVIMLDADFQHPLAAIPEMVARWQAGADMVYATKASREAEPWLHRVGSALFYRLLAPGRGLQIPKDAGDFRLLDRKVVEALRAMPERNRFMKGMYAWVGFRSEAISVQFDSRAAGASKFGTLRLARLAITGFTAFSNAPLRLVTGAGMVISLLATLMAAWLVFEHLLFGQSIPGFTTLGAGIFFLSGVQLVALGVVGEYVGRIFEEVKQRPPYLVANRRQSAAPTGNTVADAEARRLQPDTEQFGA